MAEIPSKPVLLTGAAGGLGSHLAGALGAAGWTLRLTDAAPFPGALPEGATFSRADLEDSAAIGKLAEGCGAIVHFGAAARDQPFEEIAGPNIHGLYYIYEAARREGARVVFASSNHAFGYHERTAVLDADAPFMPDSYYGVSKVFGEALGRLYWMKHGVESVFLRLGLTVPEPFDQRGLTSWLAYGDLTSMVMRAVLSDQVGCDVIWGASNNSRMTWWRGDARDKLGWAPEESADQFADELMGKVSDDPIVERFQGGAFCAAGYSRKEPPPKPGK